MSFAVNLPTLNILICPVETSPFQPRLERPVLWEPWRVQRIMTINVFFFPLTRWLFQLVGRAGLWSRGDQACLGACPREEWGRGRAWGTRAFLLRNKWSRRILFGSHFLKTSPLPKNFQRLDGKKQMAEQNSSGVSKRYARYLDIEHGCNLAPSSFQG